MTSKTILEGKVQHYERPHPARRRRRVMEMFDFEDGNGPVPAHRHENGGGWVAKTAKVGEDAYVGPDAWVFGEAKVFGDAKVSGNAWVYGDARVYGEAWVYGDAWVSGEKGRGLEAEVKRLREALEQSLDSLVFAQAELKVQAHIPEADAAILQRRIDLVRDVLAQTPTPQDGEE